MKKICLSRTIVFTYPIPVKRTQMVMALVTHVTPTLMGTASSLIATTALLLSTDVKRIQTEMALGTPVTIVQQRETNTR